MKKNKIKSLVAFGVFVVALASISVLVMQSSAQPPTVVEVNWAWEDEDLDAAHVRTIQEGVNNVSEGGTIIVYDGVYKENVKVNKSVTIVPASTPIVDGMQSGYGFGVTADWVNISGFIIYNCTDGIHLTHANHSTIENNIIYNNTDDGVDVKNSHDCTISDNTIYNSSDDGIYIKYSDNCTIDGNTVYNNSYGDSDDGIGVRYSHNCTISDNTIYGVEDEGIYLSYSHNCTISGNTVYDNTDGGIDLYRSNNVTITGNTLYGNDDGIEMTSNNSTIINNTIYDNLDKGIMVEEHSAYITIIYNEIYQNNYGIYVVNQSTTEIHWNNIYDNVLYGVYHEVHSSPWVNATYNWWGDITGPHDPSPPGTDGLYNDGEGDNVTDYVLYSPWLNAPYPDGIPIVGAVIEYIPAGETRTLEHWKARGCQVTVYSSCDNKIIVTIYLGNPVGALLPPLFNVGEYFDVVIDKPECIQWSINITIYYTQAELDASGVYENELEGIRFWNDTAGEWQLFEETGVNPADVTVGGIDYAGFVWANADHLTPVIISGFDTSPPTTTLTPGDPHYISGGIIYVTDETEINLTATSKGCGVNHTYYRVYNAFNHTWWPQWREYTGNFTLEGEGIHHVEFYSEDKCGNVENINNETLFVDTTPPRMDENYREIGEPKYNDPGEWYVTEDTLITLASEDDGAGVYQIKYRVNGGPWITYTGPFTFCGECDHLLEVNVTDCLGNYNNTYSEMFHVDLTGPTTHLYLIGPQYGVFISTDTIIRLVGDDSVGPHNTGIKEVHYKLNNVQQNITVEEDAEEISFTLGVSGTNHLEYWSVDNLGNEGEHFFTTFCVDDTPPIINKTVGNPNVTENDEYWVTYSTPITVSAHDAGCAGGAGVERLEYNVLNVSGQWWYGSWQLLDDAGDTIYLDDEECTHILCLRAIDNVGNVAYHNETFHIDNSPPYVDKEYGNPFYNGNPHYWGPLYDEIESKSYYVGWQSHYINSSTPIWLNVTDEPGCGVGENWTEFRIYWWNKTHWERVDNEIGPGGYGTPLNESTNPIRLSDYDHWEECLHFIVWVTEDKLGNIDWDSQYFMVDNTPPNATKEIGQPRYPDAGEKAVDQKQMNTSSGQYYVSWHPDSLQTIQLHDYQSFIPSQPYLDAINISLYRYGDEDEVYITLYDAMKNEIASTHKEPDLSLGEEGWIQFEFDDTIQLIPGRTYYFDVYSHGDYNWTWSIDNYSGGMGWMNEQPNEVWTGQNLPFDWAFRTEYYSDKIYITTCTQLWINATDPEKMVKVSSLPIPLQFWAMEPGYGVFDFIPNPTDRWIHVEVWYNWTGPWTGGPIPLNSLTWEDTSGLNWIPVGAYDIPPHSWKEIDLLYPPLWAMGGIVKYTVNYTGDPDIFAHLLNEIIFSDYWGNSPYIERTLYNFDVHNYHDFEVTNFELEFYNITPDDIWDWYDPPPNPYMPDDPYLLGDTWYGGWGMPAQVNPIPGGGTEIIWIDPEHPVAHCEWVHFGFEINASKQQIIAMEPPEIIGYWTVHDCSTQSYHIHYRLWNGSWTDWITINNKNLTFSFWEPGLWYLEYYVTDDLGNPTEIDNETFYVYAPPDHIADFDWEPKKNLTTADTITFTAINTPPAPGDVVNYSWDFGDGSHGYGRVVAHRYEDPSSINPSNLYTVTLTVKAFDGITASTSKDFVIEPTNPFEGPRVDFTWTPIEPTTAETVQFTYTGDPVTHWEWQFGDGDISYEENPIHQYADGSNGGKNYTVYLTVQDDIGRANSTFKIIKVFNVPPIADFMYAWGIPNEMILFTDNSFDSDGSIVSWNWSFGDGNYSEQQSPTHLYADKGVYNVTLKVWDDDGSMDMITRMVYVNVTPPEPSFNYTPCCVTTDDIVTFNATASKGGYPDDEPSQRVDIVSWKWNFGDGNIGNGEITTHQFLNPGIYDVTLTVRDEYGGVNNITRQVKVYGEIIHNFFFSANTWNLITYPVQNREGVTAGDWLLAYPEIAQISRYNATSDSFESIFRDGAGGLVGTDFVFEEGVGYFVWSDEDVIITAEGYPIFSVNVSIDTTVPPHGPSQKWNFIGWFKGFNSKINPGDNPGNNITAEHLAENITNDPTIGDCIVIAKWDPTLGSYGGYRKWTEADLPGKENFWIERGDGLAVWITSGNYWRDSQCP